MAFFIGVLDTVGGIVVLIGGAFGVFGIINLMEGYGENNPGSKSQGFKQLFAGVGIAAVGLFIIPLLGGIFPEG